MRRLMGRPLPARRGQTMVLFVISLFLLTLMVCLTLSIGMKVREKMEVQAMADAAAYSNAAVTARVYNEIALLSRAQIGHMVSMAGVQSLISWTTAYRANASAIFLNYIIIAGQYAARCATHRWGPRPASRVRLLPANRSESSCRK